MKRLYSLVTEGLSWFSFGLSFFITFQKLNMIRQSIFKQGLTVLFLTGFCFLFLTSIVSLAQVQNEPNLINPIPPSPNAASLGAYGNTPVSLYTGQANVSIPIFNVTQDNFSLPISLSYNSTGLKVEEIASNVGLGWALNAGGVITRTVFGRDDFGANGFQTTTYEIPTDLPTDGTFGVTNEQHETLWEFAKQNQDSEPDVFYFNFAGHSGKFVIDKAGVPHTIPHQKLKITRVNGWTIVAEDGFEFQFSTSEYQQSKQYSIVNSSESSGDLNNFISSWYLTKIKFPNSNKSIVFEYLPPDGATSWYTGNYDRKRIKELASVDQDATSYSLNVVNTVRLSRIVYENGEISFEYGKNRCDLVGDKILQEIIVKNTSAELIRKFVFKYTYDGWIGSDAATVPTDCGLRTDVSLRLMLKEIAEVDSENVNTKPPYKFSYNEGDLPPRNSKSQDYWGYYNGSNNVTLIPDAVIPGGLNTMYTNFGTDRNPNFEYAKKGILKTVEYPTAGSTTFEYEPNYVHPNNYIDLPPKIIRNQKVFPITTQEFSVYKESELIVPGINGSGTFRFSGSITCGGCHYIRWTLLKQQPDGAFVGVWTGYDLTVDAGNGSIIMREDDVFKLSHEILVHESIYKGAMSPGYSLDLVWIGTQPTEPLTMTGGVRISKITDYDPVAKVKNVRMFEYKQTVDNEYSGFIVSSLKNFIDYYEETTALQSNAPTTLGYYNMTSTNNVPLTTTQGSHVGYSEVCEYAGIEDFDNKFNSNGKTIYKYWAPDLISDQMPTRDNNYQEYSGFPYANVMSQDWKRGLIKEQTVYSLVSGAFKEVKKTNYNYTFIDKTNPNTNYSSVVGFKVGISTEYIFLGAATRSNNYTKFKWGYYKYESGYPILNSVVEKTYDQNDVSKFSEKTISYSYNLNNLQVAQEEVNTGAEKQTTVYTYPKDYTDGSGFIKELVDANIITVPIEKVLYQEDMGGNNRIIIGGQINLYDGQGKGHLEKIKQMESISPVLLSTFKFSNQQNAGTLPMNGIKTTFSPDARYTDRVTYSYDAATDKIVSVKTDKQTKLYIWGYNNTLPVAEVVNAAPAEIAYTGFEHESTGNWTVGTSYNTTQKFTGDFSYTVSPLNTISKTGLTTTATYVVSFWAQSGVPTVNGSAPTSGQTINGWTYYEKTVTGTTTVTLAGNGIIDELRLYPSAAQMTTYSYSPGVGVTVISDVNNLPAFYEYDSLGRLSVIKDFKGSVIKAFQYNYQIK